MWSICFWNFDHLCLWAVSSSGDCFRDGNQSVCDVFVQYIDSLSSSYAQHSQHFSNDSLLLRWSHSPADALLHAWNLQCSFSENHWITINRLILWLQLIPNLLYSNNSFLSISTNLNRNNFSVSIWFLIYRRVFRIIPFMPKFCWSFNKQFYPIYTLEYKICVDFLMRSFKELRFKLKDLKWIYIFYFSFG